MSNSSGGAGEGPAVKDRWWVDLGEKQGDRSRSRSGPVGARFYRAGEGFEQEVARSRLTDVNLKLLEESNPPEGGWAYLQLTDDRVPERECERIKRLVDLPPYARGALIDSGRSVRLLITGTPIGERILELALYEAPSLDCWVQGDWVREEVFENQREAIAALRRYIKEFLSLKGIAAREAVRAQA